MPSKRGGDKPAAAASVGDTTAKGAGAGGGTVSSPTSATGDEFDYSLSSAREDELETTWDTYQPSVVGGKAAPRTAAAAAADAPWGGSHRTRNSALPAAGAAPAPAVSAPTVSAPAPAPAPAPRAAVTPSPTASGAIGVVDSSTEAPAPVARGAATAVWGGTGHTAGSHGGEGGADPLGDVDEIVLEATPAGTGTTGTSRPMVVVAPPSAIGAPAPAPTAAAAVAAEVSPVSTGTPTPGGLRTNKVPRQGGPLPLNAETLVPPGGAAPSGTSATSSEDARPPVVGGGDVTARLTGSSSGGGGGGGGTGVSGGGGSGGTAAPRSMSTKLRDLSSRAAPAAPAAEGIVALRVESVDDDHSPVRVVGAPPPAAPLLSSEPSPPVESAAPPVTTQRWGVRKSDASASAASAPAPAAAAAGGSGAPTADSGGDAMFVKRGPLSSPGGGGGGRLSPGSRGSDMGDPVNTTGGGPDARQPRGPTTPARPASAGAAATAAIAGGGGLMSPNTATAAAVGGSSGGVAAGSGGAGSSAAAAGAAAAGGSGSVSPSEVTLLPVEVDAIASSVSMVARLTEDEIGTLRNASAISDVVAVLAGAVCMLLGEKPSWKQAVALLSLPDFRERVAAVDALRVPMRNVHVIQSLIVSKKLREYIAGPGAACDPVRQRAEYALVSWVLNVCAAVLAAHERAKAANRAAAAAGGAGGAGSRPPVAPAAAAAAAGGAGGTVSASPAAGGPGPAPLLISTIVGADAKLQPFIDSFAHGVLVHKVPVSFSMFARLSGGTQDRMLTLERRGDDGAYSWACFVPNLCIRLRATTHTPHPPTNTQTTLCGRSRARTRRRAR